MTRTVWHDERQRDVILSAASFPVELLAISAHADLRIIVAALAVGRDAEENNLWKSAMFPSTVQTVARYECKSVLQDAFPSVASAHELSQLKLLLVSITAQVDALRCGSCHFISHDGRVLSVTATDVVPARGVNMSVQVVTTPGTENSSLEISESSIVSLSHSCALQCRRLQDIWESQTVQREAQCHLAREFNAAHVRYALFWPISFGIPVACPISGTCPDAMHNEALKRLLLPAAPWFAGRWCLDGADTQNVDSFSRLSQWMRHDRYYKVPERPCRFVFRGIHKHAAILPPRVIEGSTKATVTDNSYDYYHYRVDGFDDSGWGCAYRSLQTVLSWFEIVAPAHFSAPQTFSMPSVRDIQTILANVDPAKTSTKNFVGSKAWIGSVEVMLVLQFFMPNLECMIKRLERGSELDDNPEIQQLLFNHFERRGPPVMIGGDAYAHTILGVQLNRRTCEAQYLILDPHYNAMPTVEATVGSKGWCGWKNAREFFNSNQWYNLCIPKV